jgi:hypothetical protein
LDFGSDVNEQRGAGSESFRVWTQDLKKQKTHQAHNFKLNSSSASLLLVPLSSGFPSRPPRMKTVRERFQRDLFLLQTVRNDLKRIPGLDNSHLQPYGRRTLLERILHAEK